MLYFRKKRIKLHKSQSSTFTFLLVNNLTGFVQNQGIKLVFHRCVLFPVRCFLVVYILFTVCLKHQQKHVNVEELNDLKKNADTENTSVFRLRGKRPKNVLTEQ